MYIINHARQKRETAAISISKDARLAGMVKLFCMNNKVTTIYSLISLD